MRDIHLIGKIDIQPCLYYKTGKYILKKKFAKLFLNDSHRFVRLKAQEICS